MKLADLPVIEVKRVMSIKDAKTQVGQPVENLEANVTEAGIYVDADSKEPFLAYFPMEEETAALRKAVLNIKYGTLDRTSGLSNLSRTFGMSPRKVLARRESCRPSTLSVEQPWEHSVLVAFADKFAKMLKELYPDQYAHDQATMQGVDDEWKMSDDALWTSGVINKSATLPYHYDKFNFNTWSAMPVIRKKMRGGYLHFPEYDSVVACRDGWVLFFPGWKYLHGVTPMQPLGEDAYRYSVVYYALKGMKDCFTYAAELAQATKNRTERELRAAEELKNRE